MKHLMMQAIRAYQRWVSPHKGHACAHRVHRWRVSGCSGVGLRAIRRYGAWQGLLLLRQRIKRCAQSAQALQTQTGSNPTGRWRPHAQRGDCDLGCDALSCASDAGCGWDCSSTRLDRWVVNASNRLHARWMTKSRFYRWLQRDHNVIWLVIGIMLCTALALKAWGDFAG